MKRGLKDITRRGEAQIDVTDPDEKGIERLEQGYPDELGYQRTPMKRGLKDSLGALTSLVTINNPDEKGIESTLLDSYSYSETFKPR